MSDSPRIFGLLRGGKYHSIVKYHVELLHPFVDRERKIAARESTSQRRSNEGDGRSSQARKPTSPQAPVP